MLHFCTQVRLRDSGFKLLFQELSHQSRRVMINSNRNTPFASTRGYALHCQIVAGLIYKQRPSTNVVSSQELAEDASKLFFAVSADSFALCRPLPAFTLRCRASSPLRPISMVALNVLLGGGLGRDGQTLAGQKLQQRFGGNPPLAGAQFDAGKLFQPSIRRTDSGVNLVCVMPLTCPLFSPSKYLNI